jgi:hypothetical protein
VEPEQIVPVPGAIAAPGAGPITMTLPHESVTVVRVPVQ